MAVAVGPTRPGWTFGQSIRSFVKEHPVLAYFALTFAISWTATLVVIGGPGGIPATSEEVTRLFPAVYLATVAGPSLTAIFLTGLVGGWAGYRGLGSRLLMWRVGVRWYAVALLTAPFTVIAPLLTLSLASPAFLPGFLTTSDGASASGLGLSMSLGMILGLSLFNGFVEELGWTGFAIPKMYSRYGVFATGLSVGLLWGGSHFASNIWGSGGDASPLPLGLFMAVLLFSFLPPYRVLMVWLYDRTASLLLAMLMHASLNFFWLASAPPGLTAVPLATWYAAWAAMLWGLVAAVAVANGGKLTRQPLASGAEESGAPARRAA
jgi:membrane protease YdiL (CAAX protease family)